MSRLLLLSVLVLSVCSMGASTCRFSSGGGKKKDRDGSGVVVVVDTRTSGSGASVSDVDIGPALAASVLPQMIHAPSLEAAFGPQASLAGAAGAGFLLEPADLDDLGSRSIAAAMPGRSSAPEPAAVWLFASGVTLVGWQLRRHPLRGK